MNKRVLFIAYLFPPIANSGTQRPLKFVKYLPTLGWDPIVLTSAGASEQNRDEGLLADIPEGVRVVRVPMLNERIGQIAAGLGATAERLGRGLSWRLRDRFRHPDVYALWRPTARRAAMRIFRESGFDAVYATGYPWTSLLVGQDVATATDRPLIADFRDPWAGEDLFHDQRRPYEEDLALEHGVVQRAASVIAVSDTMIARLRAAHPDVDPARFVTIHNGYDPPDLVAPALARSSKFRFVFAGVWKHGYSPAALYDAIDRLRQESPETVAGIEVVAAGFPPGEAARRGLSEYISEVGVLSHRDAVSLMRSADVLFLSNGLGARQQLGLPGKMFEYLATGRPVLALTAPDGDAGRLIRQVGGGVVVDPDAPGEFHRVVARACRTRTLITPARDRAAIAAFDRVALTRLLAAELDKAARLAPHAAASLQAPLATHAALR